MIDLISRQAAIEALGEAPEVWTDSPEEFAALSQWEMDVTAIKALPSAEPKTGRWILADEQPQEDADNDNYHFVCSECGKIDVHSKAVNVSYCWNCGAKMLGGGDEE